MPDPFRIYPEDTPNPLSNKFNLNRTLLNGPGRDFPNRQLAELSPLATDIYYIPGVTGVFIGQNFVTVTILPGNSWWAMRPLVEQAIESFIQRGEPAVKGNAGTPEPPAGSGAGADRPFSESEVGILRILEEEIRPAVAMDGGDITLVAYENKIVKLRLRGACHACPSSIVTLKMGIENRLKQAFPEIVGVEAV
ncbi:MAG TPA: NifU family protein [Planctomycetota bacterium]|nr:NifU family protein [Planctomycetota bacterium]